MGHSLLLVLVPPDKTYSQKYDEGDFELYEVMDPHSGTNVEGEFERFSLDVEGGPPLPKEHELRRWKMTQRQARLEIQRGYPNPEFDHLSPNTPLEELAQIRNQRREFAGERYWVEGDYICAESPANPYAKHDWYQEGGRWADFFADPPPWERPLVTRQCPICKGRGEIPGKRYLLPRPIRLTAEARADDGRGTVCVNCQGKKEFIEPEYFEDVPDEQMHKSIPEVMAIIEYYEECWPWALVDEKGVWHGTEGGWGYGVPEEETPRDTLEAVILKPLREAPEGTTVIVLDIHM